MKDDKIIIKIDADTSVAEKKLDQLLEKIDKIEKKVSEFTKPGKVGKLASYTPKTEIHNHYHYIYPIYQYYPYYQYPVYPYYQYPYNGTYYPTSPNDYIWHTQINCDTPTTTANGNTVNCSSNKVDLKVLEVYY